MTGENDDIHLLTTFAISRSGLVFIDLLLNIVFSGSIFYYCLCIESVIERSKEREMFEDIYIRPWIVR